MKASDALDVLAFVRLVWRLPVPAADEDLDLAVWPKELAHTDLEDALVVVRRFEGGFAPTVLQIVAAARVEARYRSPALELPSDDDRPECCRSSDRAFDHWVEAHAGAEDRERLERLSPATRASLERIG